MTIEEVRAQRERDRQARLTILSLRASMGPVPLDAIPLPAYYPKLESEALQQIASELQQISEDMKNRPIHTALDAAGKLLAYALKFGAFSEIGATRRWRAEVESHLCWGDSGPSFGSMFVKAVEASQPERWLGSDKRKFLATGCELIAARVRKDKIATTDASPSFRQGVYLTPRQCINRLPFDGVPDHQRYARLARIRKKCSAWLRTQSVGNSIRIHEDDFVSVRPPWQNVATTTYSVAGYVDSQNSYGAMLRGKYLVIFVGPDLARGHVIFYGDDGSVRDFASFGDGSDGQPVISRLERAAEAVKAAK